MDTDSDRQYVKVKKSFLLVAILVLAAIVLGWWLGRMSGPEPQPISTSSPTPAPVQPTNESPVKSIVSYTLPDRWQEAMCPNASSSVFIIPAGAPNADCNAQVVAPVTISVDQESNKDCNQLQDVKEVRKHVCISLYINGHRSLKATTEYLASSQYGKDMIVDAYYIDTGEEVVKIEYTRESGSEFQSGFDQLANSVKRTN